MNRVKLTLLSNSASPHPFLYLLASRTKDYFDIAHICVPCLGNLADAKRRLRPLLSVADFADPSSAESQFNSLVSRYFSQRADSIVPWSVVTTFESSFRGKIVTSEALVMPILSDSLINSMLFFMLELFRSNLCQR